MYKHFTCLLYVLSTHLRNFLCHSLETDFYERRCGLWEGMTRVDHGSSIFLVEILSVKVTVETNSSDCDLELPPFLQGQ